MAGFRIKLFWPSTNHTTSTIMRHISVPTQNVYYILFLVLKPHALQGDMYLI